MEENQEGLTTEFKRLPGESVLEYTQRIRQGVVEKVTENGLPSDEDQMYALASYLDAMDRQEIAKQKMVNEEKALETDKMATAIVASMLGKLGNHNPFMVEENTGNIVEHDVELPQVNLVPGELDHNQRVLNYDNFVTDYRKKHPKEVEEED